jgi:glycosyltransferase involved in cell wall biosynthesis
MKRVLVDLLFLNGRRGGTETYTREVYRRFADVEDIEFIAYAPTETVEQIGSWFPGTVIESGVSSNNRAVWALGEFVKVSRAAERLGADLIHSPANLGPIRSRVPIVLTLHDVLPFRHPEWVPTRASGGLLRWMIKSTARAASHIITDSNASRDDIIDLFGFEADRVSVTPLAAAEVREPAVPVARRDDMIFAPGNRMRHKNIATLIEAMSLIPASSRPHLILTGAVQNDPLVPVVAAHGLENDITINGWMPQDELERAYREAALVVFPTRFEGFGLPVLEGMSYGAPVLCSDLPVLREVGGDAAHYVDSLKPELIAAEVSRLLADPQERQRMSTAGLARSTEFSWDDVAQRTLEIFRHQLAGFDRA